MVFDDYIHVFSAQKYVGKLTVTMFWCWQGVIFLPWTSASFSLSLSCQTAQPKSFILLFYALFKLFLSFRKPFLESQSDSWFLYPPVRLFLLQSSSWSFDLEAVLLTASAWSSLYIFNIALFLTSILNFGVWIYQRWTTLFLNCVFGKLETASQYQVK